MPDVVIPNAPKEKNRPASLLNDYPSRHSFNATQTKHYQENKTYTSRSNGLGNDSSFGVSMDMSHSDNTNYQPHENHSHSDHHLDSASERILKVTCIISIVAWLISIVILSIVSEASPFWTFLGMSPLLLTIITTFILVDKYHMDTGFLMVFPFIFTGIFLLFGVAGFLGPLNFLLLCSINIVLGLIFEVILVAQHAMIHMHNQDQDASQPKEKKEHVEEIQSTSTETIIETSSQKLMLATPLDVEKFVASIEDKAKAINAVIGRVYSVRKGGSESLRKKIRIDPTHYNEFNELKGKTAAKRLAIAQAIITKIKQKLTLLEKSEFEVFDTDDMHMLVNLNRQKDGHDRVIDVLAKNDSDPVKTYYEGAVQFCDNANKDLGEQIEAKKSEIKPIAQKKPIAKRLITFVRDKKKKSSDKKKKIVI